MAEIVYDIKFTVDRATPKVTPTAPQKAGYYGDDNAARLTFSGVDDSFDYQIEIVDGNGAYDITETLNTDGAGNLVYEVPSAWTAAGLASVRLVELGEERVLHYPEVQLLFEARDTGEQMGDMLPRWQSVMRDSEAATQDAIEAAEYATQAGEFAASQTPNIQNGEWYLGDQNTGVQAVGEQGPRGLKGEKGDPGSAITKKTLTGNVFYIADAPQSYIQKAAITTDGVTKPSIYRLNDYNQIYDIPEQQVNGVTLSKTDDGCYVLNGIATTKTTLRIGTVKLYSYTHYALLLGNQERNMSLTLSLSVGYSTPVGNAQAFTDIPSVPDRDTEVLLAFDADEYFHNFVINPQLRSTRESYGAVDSVVLDGSETILYSPEMTVSVTYEKDGFIEIKEQLGDIETALDGIITIQENLIGGDTV